MINQPTILGFPITPWFILFIVSAIVAFIGIIILIHDIKKKDIGIINNVNLNGRGFSDSKLPLVPSTEAFGETEGFGKNYGTGQTTGSVFSGDKTTGIYGHDKTSSVFDENSTSSFNSTESNLKTGLINNTNYISPKAYCTKCGNQLGGGAYCTKCGTQI